MRNEMNSYGNSPMLQCVSCVCEARCIDGCVAIEAENRPLHPHTLSCRLNNYSCNSQIFKGVRRKPRM